MRSGSGVAPGGSPATSPAAILRSERWFAGLESEVQEAMLGGGFVRHFKRGQALFRQGDEPSGLFAVIRGQAQSQAENNEGKTIVLAVFHAPDWVGFLACADGRPFTFDVIASIDSDIYFAPIQLVHSLFHSSPDRYMYLLSPQLSSLRKIYLYLTNTIHLKPIERLAFRLIDFSRSPWYEDGVTHPIRGLSQDLLAASIMSNRPDTNKMLGQLEEERLIKRSYKQIDIIDLPSLERLTKINN